MVAGEPMTLRELLHELTDDYTHLDKPVTVAFYDSGSRCTERYVVEGVACRAGSQSLKLRLLDG